MTDERTKKRKMVIVGLVCALLSLFLFLSSLGTIIVFSVIAGIGAIIMVICSMIDFIINPPGPDS